MNQETKCNFICQWNVRSKGELAYRENVEMLQLQSHGDSRMVPLPAQVPCPSPGPSPEQWTRLSSSPSSSLSASSLQCLQPLYLPLLDGNHVVDMVLQLSSVFASSLQCLPPLYLPLLDGNHVLENQTDHLFCNVCKVYCSGVFNHKLHYRGRLHRDKVQELKLSRKEGRKKANQRQLCKLCMNCEKFCARMNLCLSCT